MGEYVLCAAERVEKANRVRKEGFVPGTVYGKGIGSISIKMDQKELRNLLKHSLKTNVSVKIGDDVKRCIIREIQKDPVSGHIIHVSLQTIQSDDIIRLKVPVIYHGKEKLGPGLQLLQERVPEVEIMGKAADIPEYVSIDVSGRQPGDKITVGDIQVENNIKIIDDKDDILAVVTEVHEYSEAV